MNPLWSTRLLFFVAGAAALIVETTWLRWLRSLFGATAPAVAMMLAAISIGRAVGAFASRSVLRRGAAPLRMFGILQLGIVVFAAAVPGLLGAAGNLAAPLSIKIALALIVTLPVSASIGASLPLLVAASARDTTEMGNRASGLYAAELFGAALGTAAAIFWLPPFVGVVGGYTLGIGLCAAVGGAGLWFARGSAEGDTAEHDCAGPVPDSLVVLSLAAASGFGLFSAQLLVHRALDRVLSQSTLALGTVLSATLFCLALGALLAVFFERRWHPRPILLAVAAGAAIGFAVLPAVLVGVTDGLRYQVSTSVAGAHGLALGLFACVAGLPVLAAGVVLPVTFAWSGQSTAADGRAAGRLSAGLLVSNTIGAVCGVVVLPFYVVPTIGLWPAFAVVGALYALMMLLVASNAKTIGVIALASLVAAYAQPWRQPDLRLAPGFRLVDAETTPGGYVAVLERAGELYLQTDNHYMLGGTAEAVHQERQGHIPLLFHPQPRRVAFVGSATGSSAGAALAHGPDQLVLIEIMPAVTRAAAKYFAETNRGVYQDERSVVVADDVRSYFRRTDDDFDVIVADLFVPWRAETGALYTREHFELVSERLAAGGLFCQWLPLYQLERPEFLSILATFAEVFPDAVVVRGDFYGNNTIVGLMGGGRVADPRIAAASVSRLVEAGHSDRWVTHPLGPWALYLGKLDELAEHYASAPLNTADLPVVEFLAARHQALAGRAADRGVGGTQFASMIAPLAGRKDDDSWTSQAEREAMAAGTLLQLASSLYDADDAAGAARSFGEAARLLPPELVREAPPDASAVDVWGVDGGAQ